jgi:hypothetical protein
MSGSDLLVAEDGRVQLVVDSGLRLGAVADLGDRDQARGERVEDRLGGLGVLVPGLDELGPAGGGDLAGGQRLVDRGVPGLVARVVCASRPAAASDWICCSTALSTSAMPSGTTGVVVVSFGGSARSARASCTAATMVSASASAGKPTCSRRAVICSSLRSTTAAPSGWVFPSADAVGGLGAAALGRHAASAAGWSCSTSSAHRALASMPSPWSARSSSAVLGPAGVRRRRVPTRSASRGDGLGGGVPGAVGSAVISARHDSVEPPARLAYCSARFADCFER